MVDLSDSIFNKTPGLDATRTSDLSPAPSRAREAAPRLLSCRLAQPRRCSRSRLPPQVTFLAARRRSPPPHPLVIAQTGPRTGIASSPHLCAQPRFFALIHNQPPPARLISPAPTHTRKDNPSARRKDSRYRTGRRNHGARRKSPRYC